MKNDRYIITKSYILDYETIREIDRNFTFISHDLGINKATAFGAEKIKSRFCPAVQPFVKLDLFLNRNPKNGLLKLDDIDNMETNDFIKKDINLIYLASSYVEVLLNSYIEQNESKSYFYLFDYSIKLLENDVIKSFIFFIAKFLYLTGYRFNLEYCNNCKKSSKLYFFDLKNDIIMCDNCAIERSISLSNETVYILNNFFEKRFIEIKNLEFNKGIIVELLPLIIKFLTKIFNKELRTFHYFNKIFNNYGDIRK